jgi:hypothetical protein
MEAPLQARAVARAGGRMSSPGNRDIGTGDRPDAIAASRGLLDARDPWLRPSDEGAVRLPLAGQPGHGRTASLRRQPVRIVDGRMEGGYTELFELICPGCGDHPYLDYREISPRLQRLRGPRTLMAGLASYERHLGLAPGPDKAGPGNSGADPAKTGMA